MKKSIRDFFKTNFDLIPNITFAKHEIRMSREREAWSYTKQLENIECDIFTDIEVVEFDDETKSIFFMNNQLKTVSIEKVQELIDNLYNVFGQDDNHKDRFSLKDKEDFYSDYFCIQLRQWYNIDLPMHLERNVGSFTLRIFEYRKNKH